MAFWGVEVKPGKPYVHLSDDERGRLHVSQATLGTGSSTKKSIIQCRVGDKKPINLCSLFPESLENCALNLEFEEEDEVTFSVIGHHSVHLSGFFFGDNEDQGCLDDDCGSDHYEENIIGMDSEDEDDSIDYDSEDEDDDEDEYTDDDFSMYPPSPVPNSGVKIEEIVDEEKPTNENGMSKRAKKKKTQSSMSVDDENSNRQLVPKAGTGVPILESEDEDGFPISACENKSANSKSEATRVETKDEGVKTHKKSEKSDAAPGKKLKRKSDAVDLDEKPARESTEQGGSSVQPDTLSSPNEVNQKRNKKKKMGEKEESSKENGVPNTKDNNESPVVEIVNDLKPPSEKKKEKKKKKKGKQPENAPTPNAEGNITDENGSVLEKKVKKEAKSLQVRTFPNGLVIEELTMGKPNGKRASPGKKVSVRYIGKLKNGTIFDSNIGKAPFKFRLGISQVIKGWDVGVNGMRVGDKRRLTIPPAMGYGAKGAGAAIPPNSWLVFDVELVDVN